MVRKVALAVLAPAATLAAANSSSPCDISEAELGGPRLLHGLVAQVVDRRVIGIEILGHVWFC